MLRTGFHLRRVTYAGCLLALLLCARVAIARSAQEAGLQTATAEAPAPATESPAQAASAPPASPAVPPTISYVNGQLRIDALDATLAEVLTKVAALTTVNIDIPDAANSERMPVVKLGPGPARSILASLLSDLDFDYLIQASDTDPEKIQSVMVMPREKGGGKTNGTDAAVRPLRSPYARPESPVVPAQPVNAAADASFLNPQPASTQPDQPEPPPPVEPRQIVQPEQPNSTKPAPLTPPQSMDPQTINQQLQQMYQQRIQMMQQQRQAASPAAPANLGIQQAPSATVRQ